MTNVIPLPFKGDILDYFSIGKNRLDWLWRDGEAYIAVKPICDMLGVAWQPQHRKLTAPDSEATIDIMVTVGGDGKQREMLCIAYPDFMMWLSHIHVAKVKEEARPGLRVTKREMKLLVANHYRSRVFGEASAAIAMSKKLMNEVLIGKRDYQRVVNAHNLGLTFQQLKASWRHVSVEFVVQQIMTCFRLDLIDRLPAGMPARQADLFSREV